MRRVHINLHGAVQGVGFRQFVCRLASELGLGGWVRNGAQGVSIELEGPRGNSFIERLRSELSPHATIQSLAVSNLEPVGYHALEIRESDASGEKAATVMPDLARCADCLREILDPRNRRFQYLFTNCTYCGPRYSIIEATPNDRTNTSM
jgi:hydrogenase maturation protein HypF